MGNHVDNRLAGDKCENKMPSRFGEGTKDRMAGLMNRIRKASLNHLHCNLQPGKQTRTVGVAI